MQGSAGKDLLQGFAGNDTLNGGSGIDVLIGGPGRDVFVFDLKTMSSEHADVIYDFTAKDDLIHLSHKAFANLGAKGKLQDDAFYIGANANDESDRIIFDGGYTGNLFYDPDGTGPIQQVKFAGVTHDVNLKASHFLIV
jgi:Ca2+-binding RTX toxin-like protein